MVQHIIYIVILLFVVLLGIAIIAIFLRGLSSARKSNQQNNQ